MAAQLARSVLGRLAPTLSLACGSIDPNFGAGASESRVRCEAGLSPRDIDATFAENGGRSLELSGVATLALDDGGRSGFFIQSAVLDRRANGPQALLARAAPGTAPPAGTLVRVRGQVAESPLGRELVAIERIDECGRHRLEPMAIDLSDPEEAARWQNVWVEARADWAVLDAKAGGPNAGVFASATGRQYASGHVLGNAPHSERWRIVPAVPSGAANARRLSPRLGARLERISGVLAASPERTLYTPEAIEWHESVPSPPERAQVSSLRIVALNLDNYFVDPSGPRARPPEELAQQRAKLAATLLALDADVLALTELENRGTESLEHLLAGLEPSLAPEHRYAFSASNPRDGAISRAAIAYRPARVSPRGEAWFAEQPGFRRAPLFQSFATASRRFTVGVVHFTSKRCDGTPTVVPSEGCGALQRQSEAALLLQAVRAWGAEQTPEPLLVTGDFNSDALEAPLRALEDAGFVDLLARLPAGERYSYVFEGRASLLDHALALNGMAELAEGAAIWHINADEPLARERSELYAGDTVGTDPRGSSDHDPIVVDLRP
jgi:uncharacterized protein